MRNFYLKDIPGKSVFEMPEEESKHIVRVLRMTAGDEFVLLNGVDKVLRVAILEEHPKRCKVEVKETRLPKKSERQIHLAIAPTKNLDRMEWMVEKIVEIGATELTFIQTQRSERVNLKLDRLERVAISAMKQAQHETLLKMNPLVTFNEFIENHSNGAIAHCMDGNKSALGSFITGPVLIGPEGDFSAEEVEKALENGYTSVHLGESRLRTETAGMVAVVLQIHG